MAVVHNNQISWDIGHDNKTTDKDNNNDNMEIISGERGGWAGGLMGGRAGGRQT